MATAITASPLACMRGGQPPVQLRQTVRLLLAVPPLLAVSSVITTESIPAPLRIAVAAIALLAAARPREALLIVAALGPLVDVVASLAGWPPVRALEALVLAFLAGWFVSAPPAEPRGARERLAPPLWLLASLVVGSAATDMLDLHRSGEWRTAMSSLAASYFTTGESAGLAQAAGLLEGLALTAAVVELATPALVVSLTRAMAAAAVAAAVLALLLVGGIGLPPTIARQSHIGLARFSAHIPDVNAAASYYLLMLGIACGMLATTNGIRRRTWIAVGIVIGMGLVLTGSRAAVIAGVVTSILAACVMVVSGRSQRQRAIAAVVLVAGVLAVVVAITAMRTSLLSGSESRLQFNQASLRMIAARPVFGVGIGRYYPLSRLVLPPELGAIYGQENAHNYFMQIAAELGMAGAAVFVWLLAASLGPAGKALWNGARSALTTGLVAGAVAFLITCLSGHPLLVPETAVPFWIVLGLIVVTTPPMTARLPARGRRVATLAAAVLIVASAPFRPAQPRLHLSAGQDGFGPWQVDADGRRFRESAEYASVFVGPDATAVTIALRAAPERHEHDLAVEYQVPGRSRTTTVANRWTPLTIDLPGAGTLVPLQRINFTVIDEGGAPSDPQRSGVQFGEAAVTTTRD